MTVKCTHFSTCLPTSTQVPFPGKRYSLLFAFVRESLILSDDPHTPNDLEEESTRAVLRMLNAACKDTDNGVDALHDIYSCLQAVDGGMCDGDLSELFNSTGPFGENAMHAACKAGMFVSTCVRVCVHCFLRVRWFNLETISPSYCCFSSRTSPDTRAASDHLLHAQGTQMPLPSCSDTYLT